MELTGQRPATASCQDFSVVQHDPTVNHARAHIDGAFRRNAIGPVARLRRGQVSLCSGRHGGHQRRNDLPVRFARMQPVN